MQSDPWSPGSAPTGYGPPGSAPPGYGPTGSAPTGYGPTGYGPPGSAPPGYGPTGYAPTPPPRTPGTVVALRLVAWVQVLFLLLGMVLAGAIAVASGTALRSSDDELTQGFAGLGLILGVVFAAFWLVLVVLVAVPTALLRTGRRSRKLGSLITLTVVESLFAAVGLLLTVTALGSDRPSDALWPFLVALVPTAVVVLAMVPASRAWASHAAPPA